MNKMGVNTFIDDNSTKTRYRFQRKGGKNIIEHRPVFSPDGESVLLIVENLVRVYSIKTGDWVRTLETEAHVKELISIRFPHDETYNLYGCSENGCITTWTWENGAVLRETNLPIPRDRKIVTFDLVGDNVCFVTAMEPSQIHLILALYSVKTGELVYGFRDTNVLHCENMIRVAIGWCYGDRFAAVANGTSKLFVQNLREPRMKHIIKNANAIRIISVAAHHTESAIAITDALGRAQVIRGNLYDYINTGWELLHWHFLPVTAVCFSLQGSYVYSGGTEKVLVKWTVGHLANKAKEKEFIPRLPGMIRFIATNNTHVAASLTNNSIIIANAQMRVETTILECGGLSPLARALRCPLIYHQRLGGLLMGGRTGHLQLYSTTTDKVLYNIDITETNSLSAGRTNIIPLETEITCAAVSENGSWLVTSEYRNDGITYPEERLKFWSLQIKNACPFKLNTCVNLSHGGCNIVSIALNYKGQFCVTAGTDQKFRIWKRDNTTQPHRKKVSWTCLTACYYSSGVAHFLSHGILNNFKRGHRPPEKGEAFPYLRNFKDKNDVVRKLVNIHHEYDIFDESVVNCGMRRDEENDMGGVAISKDGSLIAAWFGCKLTLWDTHLCNLRTSLSHPALRPKGVHVKFGNHDACHYLVCTTETVLAVWSILSCTMKWIVPISPLSLAVDTMSNRMAVTTTNNDVFVFSPHSSTPILAEKRLLDPKLGVLKQSTFGTASGDDIKLYVTRNDSEVYCLEPEQSEQGRLEVISRSNLPASNFGALLAEQQLIEVKSGPAGAVQQLDTNSLGNSAIAQFLSAAPHMVPPVSLLCTSFLQHISGREQPEPTAVAQADIMEIDGSSSEDEEDLKKEPYAPKPTRLWTPNYEKVKEKRLQKIAKEPLLDLHVTETIFGV